MFFLVLVGVSLVQFSFSNIRKIPIFWLLLLSRKVGFADVIFFSAVKFYIEMIYFLFTVFYIDEYLIPPLPLWESTRDRATFFCFPYNDPI